MEKIRFAVVDDHAIFRQGLRHALSGRGRLELIFEADSGESLLEQMEKTPVDLVLMDLKMPGMGGIEATRRLRQNYEDLKIIVLTMFDEEQMVLHLMEAGANGYLLKNADAEEIVLAIYSAMENGFYFNELVSSTMLRSLMDRKTVSGRFRPEVKLTEREIEVLRYICEEMTAAEIGERIFLSPRTVEGIRANLLSKVGVRNTAGLVLYAVRHGIVE